MGTNRQSHQVGLGVRGGTLGGTMFWVVFFGVLGFGLYLFAFPYYTYNMIRHQAYAVCEMQGLTDEDILEKMRAEGAAQGIELNAQNMKLTRRKSAEQMVGGQPRLQISWDHDVVAFGYLVTTLYFDIDTAL